jgi:hypothetical protein
MLKALIAIKNILAVILLAILMFMFFETEIELVTRSMHRSVNNRSSKRNEKE